MAILTFLRKLDHILNQSDEKSPELTTNFLLNDQNIGFVKYYFMDQICYINEIYIDPSYRDHGHGTYFLEEFIKEIKIKSFILYPDPTNEKNLLHPDEWKKNYKRLIKFYERFGFKMEEDKKHGIHMIYKKIS
jgi:ribosomal protein S18 acetylase RimI-like enzyme